MKFKNLPLKMSTLLASLLISGISISTSHAQNTCADAVVIASIPFSSGTQTTCGTGNDYTAGSYGAHASYGGGEDYVYQINITTAPVTYDISLGGAATWKILDVNTACPPTSGTSIGGVITSSSSTGNTTVTFPTNGTYYIFIDTWPSPTCGEFTLNINVPPPPPTNDDISGAEVLTVNLDLSCGTVTAGTTISATASLPAPSCNPSGANDDVWYQFTATNTNHRVSIQNVSGSSDRNMVVYESDGVTEFAGGGTCANVSTKNLSGLTIGNTYYVRVYTYSSSASTSSFFNICVGTPPPPPANDDCVNATDLSSGTYLANETTASATQEMAPTECGGYTSSDAYEVWYKVTADSDGDITVTATTVSGDIILMGYSGTCGALTLLECSDEAISSGNEEITVSALAGETYYFRVYQYSSADGAIFDIIASGDPLAIEMGNISAVNKGKVNSITWNSIKESVGDQFILERSQDGQYFHTLTTVSATGTPQTYNYNDETPFMGANYYRIKYINNDGKIMYTHTVVAHVQAKGNSISVYPNPSKGIFQIEFPKNPSAQAQIIISDITGREVQTISTFNAQTVQVDIAHLPNGIYFVKYIDNATTEVIKIVKE